MISRGKQPVRERFASGMAWAVDAKSGLPVYVGTLTPEHKGLKCGCICPACNGRLQAVALCDDSSDRHDRRAPFFRHDKKRQGPGCKFRVAELAALKLLAERGMIEIPASRKTAEYVGKSGLVYDGMGAGAAIKEEVIEHRLVSS